MSKKLSRFNLPSILKGAALMFLAAPLSVLAGLEDGAESYLNSSQKQRPIYVPHDKGGYVSTSTGPKFGQGPLFGIDGKIAIGYDSGLVRKELEYTRNVGLGIHEVPYATETDFGGVITNQIVGLAIWDIPWKCDICDRIYPGLGVGFGVNHISYDGYVYDYDDGEYQKEAGNGWGGLIKFRPVLTVELNQQTDAFFQADHDLFYTESNDNDTVASGLNISALAGMRFRF